MPADVIGRDVRDDHVVVHFDIHEQRAAVMSESKPRAAVGRVLHAPFRNVGRRNFDRTNVRPPAIAAFHRRRRFEASNRGGWNRMNFRDRRSARIAGNTRGDQLNVRSRRCRHRHAKSNDSSLTRANLVLRHRRLNPNRFRRLHLKLPLERRLATIPNL